LLSIEEAEYIRSRLETNAKLRRRWYIRRKKVPLSLVAERAYPEDPEAARHHMKAQQAQARRKIASAAKMSPTANRVGTKTGANTKGTPSELPRSSFSEAVNVSISRGMSTQRR